MAPSYGAPSYSSPSFPGVSCSYGASPGYPTPDAGYPASSGYPAAPRYGQGYPASQQQIQSVIAEVRKARSAEQTHTLMQSISLQQIQNITAQDCGAIVHCLWKDNQLAAARFLQPLCSDGHAFRQQMQKNMWMSEFK